MIAICRVKDADLEVGLMGCCWMLRRLHWLTLVFDSPEPNDAGVVVVVEALSAPQSYRLTNALPPAAELPSCLERSTSMFRCSCSDPSYTEKMSFFFATWSIDVRIFHGQNVVRKSQQE